jgi:hypothetical protein
LRIEESSQPVQESAPSVNYCPNGHAVASNKKFCETCGTPMTGAASQNNSSYSSGTFTSTSYPSPSVPNPYAPQQQSSSSAGFASLPPGSFSSNNVGNDYYQKKNNVGLFVGIGIAAVLILVLVISSVSKGSGGGSDGGDSGGGYTATSTTITVTMSINGEYCSSLSWGYGDIPGGSLILSVDGVATGFANYSYYGTDTSSSCDFTASFYNVPTSGTIYSVRMASGLRGSVDNYQYALAANGWQFNLSLG